MKKTLCFAVDKDNPDVEILKKAAEILRKGDLVAFPTETVYGLGANGLDPEAVAGIYRAKGRPGDNPLILHISSIADLKQLVLKIPVKAETLINKYWPGPLTLILQKSAIVPDIVTGGLNTVAIRLPNSTVARKLIWLSGVPLAAPSANTSGRPSPTNAQAVLADLEGRIDAVIDAGSCSIGVESTVVDLTSKTPVLLRPGGITREMLTATLGRVNIDPALKNNGLTPKSPGLKYIHYAPKYPLFLIERKDNDLEENDILPILKEKIDQALSENKKVGAIVSSETAASLPEQVVTAVYGSRFDLEAIAAGLYDALRYFDRDNRQVDVIFAEAIKDVGLGAAVMNRLRKAAVKIL